MFTNNYLRWFCVNVAPPPPAIKSPRSIIRDSHLDSGTVQHSIQFTSETNNNMTKHCRIFHSAQQQPVKEAHNTATDHFLVQNLEAGCGGWSSRVDLIVQSKVQWVWSVFIFTKCAVIIVSIFNSFVFLGQRWGGDHSTWFPATMGRSSWVTPNTRTRWVILMWVTLWPYWRSLSIILFRPQASPSLYQRGGQDVHTSIGSFIVFLHPTALLSPLQLNKQQQHTNTKSKAQETNQLSKYYILSRSKRCGTWRRLTPGLL